MKRTDAEGNGAIENQMLQAIKIILKRGGDQIKQSLLDGAANTDITGALFDKTTTKAVRIFYDLFRRNDTQSANEVGVLYITYDIETDTWKVFSQTFDGDAQVTFDVTSTGQLRYSSSTYGGTGYTGDIRLSDITALNI